MKNSKKELEIILDYNFKNSDLLKTSLIHKSFDQAQTDHYQLLIFLHLAKHVHT